MTNDLRMARRGQILAALGVLAALLTTAMMIVCFHTPPSSAWAGMDTSAFVIFFCTSANYKRLKDQHDEEG